jgi:hypothetical protein
VVKSRSRMIDQSTAASACWRKESRCRAEMCMVLSWQLHCYIVNLLTSLRFPRRAMNKPWPALAHAITCTNKKCA